MENKFIKYKILIITLIVLIIQSCASYEPIKIQVLKPAQIKVPSEILKLVIINHSVQKDTLSNNFKTKELKFNNDSILTSEYFSGLLDVLLNSPRFEIANQTPFYIEKSSKDKFEQIDWLTIDMLCKDNNADAALVLENYQLLYSDQIPLNYVDNYLHGVLQIENNSIWKIYEPSKMKVPEDFLLSDTLFWDGFGYHYDQVAQQLPAIKDALLQSCNYAGKKYGERISQTWSTKNRYIINCENKDFRMAFMLINENKWEEAIELWKKYPYGKNIRLASFAAYNLAVATEALDNIGASLEWAAKSYFLNKNSYVENYIKILEKRKLEKDLIESQFK
jgi:hypothetical protein